MPRLNSNSRPNFDRGVGRKHRTLQRKQVIAFLYPAVNTYFSLF